MRSLNPIVLPPRFGLKRKRRVYVLLFLYIENRVSGLHGIKAHDALPPGVSPGVSS